MYCSRCGKKVLDTMLYCPFCGAQIIIPDQDAPEPARPQVPKPADAPLAYSFELTDEASSETEATEEESPEVEDLFAWERDADNAAAPEADASETETPEPAEDIPKPVAKDTRAPLDRRSNSVGNIVPGRRSSGTLVPDKPLIPDESALFLDNAGDFDDDHDDDVEDDFDEFDDEDGEEDFDDFDDDDFDDFEEAVGRVSRRTAKPARSGRPRPSKKSRRRDEDDDETRGFLMRHIRGVVGVLLFLVLVAILAIYVLSDAGQMHLARINATLPLRADIYKNIAYEHYKSGEYAQSGIYYERALARAPGDFDCATSAAMAYLSAGDNDRAAEMFRKSIALKPEAVEPYLYLMNLYPNANSRPWDVAQLLAQGYELTGDERLKAANG